MACDLPGGKKEEAKFKQECTGSECHMTNVINLKITNTQNCLTSDCVQKNWGKLEYQDRDKDTNICDFWIVFRDHTLNFKVNKGILEYFTRFDFSQEFR